MKTLVAVAALAFVLASAQAAFTPVQLPVALDGLEPVISNTTMNYHYNTHYKGYVTKLNAAYGSRPQPASLSDAVASVANKGTINATDIRKQGGGAWNHALYFKTFAAPNSTNTTADALSPALSAAISKAFPGGVAQLKKNVSDAAMSVFGSGWSWLCVARGGGLLVTVTANQDNPLMGTAVSGAPLCTPILGIDVWEHAYYVDRGPARQAYVDAYWTVLNWAQVSQNYAAAVAGKTNQIVA